MTRPAIGYLSGAPRVSTRDESESVGPRAHVVGMIRGFEMCGLEVRRFIVGDRAAKAASGPGTERMLSSSLAVRAAADIARLGIRFAAQVMARRRLGHDLRFVYERFGAFQALGRAFQRRGVPWVLETNALYFIEALSDRRAILFWRLERLLELRAYRQCDVLVVISSSLRDQVIEAGVHREMLVVPNGVEASLFDSVERPLRREGEARVVFVGSAISAQGVDVLLHAVAILREQQVPIKCLIVGDGPELGAWKTMALDLKLGPIVEFVGRVPWSEVPRITTSCDVGFVGPRPTSTSSMYHSSLKLYEYLASGLSVVARREPEVVRLLEGTGYIFEPDDPASCADAIQAAIIDRRNDPELPERARSLARRESWQARAESVITEVTSRLAGAGH